MDCTRVPEKLSKAYRPVQIPGTKVSAHEITYQIFCLYERGFKLSTLCGEIENKVSLNDLELFLSFSSILDKVELKLSD